MPIIQLAGYYKPSKPTASGGETELAAERRPQGHPPQQQPAEKPLQPANMRWFNLYRKATLGASL